MKTIPVVLSANCPYCGARIGPDYRFCMVCAAELGEFFSTCSGCGDQCHHWLFDEDYRRHCSQCGGTEFIHPPAEVLNRLISLAASNGIRRLDKSEDFSG